MVALVGTAAGVVLATAGGKPAGVSGLSRGVPGTRPAPVKSASPVVPMLGGTADSAAQPIPVPVARASVTARKSTRPGPATGSDPVAPLRGL